MKPRYAGDNLCEITPALGKYSDTGDMTPWRCYPAFQTKTNSLQWVLGEPDTEDDAEFGNGPDPTTQGTGGTVRTKGEGEMKRERGRVHDEVEKTRWLLIFTTMLKKNPSRAYRHSRTLPTTVDDGQCRTMDSCRTMSDDDDGRVDLSPPVSDAAERTRRKRRRGAVRCGEAPYARVGRWRFNRDGAEPGFMDYRTMTVYPAPGYSVDLPNKESPACLRAFGSEGVELSPGVDWGATVASWRARVAAELDADADANANASAASASAGGADANATAEEALAECEVLNKIVELYEYGFVDLQTRGLYLDFNLYHPTLDRMVLVRVFFEFRPAGGVLPILDYIVFRPDKYHTFFDFVVLGAEGVILLMVRAGSGGRGRFISRVWAV